MRIARTDSSTVTGRAVVSIDETGVPVRIDTPKSPCAIRSTYWANCTGSGWSNP